VVLRFWGAAMANADETASIDAERSSTEKVLHKYCMEWTDWVWHTLRVPHIDGTLKYKDPVLQHHVPTHCVGVFCFPAQYHNIIGAVSY
jgi:hypothetical protein